jgi:hypothetical protein
MHTKYLSENIGMYGSLIFFVHDKKGLSQYKLCFKAVLTDYQRKTIKMKHKEIEREYVDWNPLARDRVQWRPIVNG